MFKDFGKRLQRDVSKIVKDRMKVCVCVLLCVKESRLCARKPFLYQISLFHSCVVDTRRQTKSEWLT